jgi:hypothetical protein
MSGPNPPETGSGAAEPDNGHSAPDEPRNETSEVAEPVEAGPSGETEAHSHAYSQAYSAPESEQFTSAPYVPADPRLYDYDGYDVLQEPDAELNPPRWPWVVGVTAIVAAIALVVSVALLFARTETNDLAIPTTTTTPSLPPVQDEITTTTPPLPPPPPPPPPTSEEPPPPPPTETETPVPPPVEAPPETTTEPPETTTAPPTTTTTTPAGPRQVTYSITGTKAPGDIITVTYVDASGHRRTQRNVYIPWSLTVTPISNSEVGSVEASSLFRLSRLNCSITTNDGTVLSSNTNDAPQTSC